MAPCTRSSLRISCSTYDRTRQPCSGLRLPPVPSVPAAHSGSGQAGSNGCFFLIASKALSRLHDTGAGAKAACFHPILRIAAIPARCRCRVKEPRLLALLSWRRRRRHGLGEGPQANARPVAVLRQLQEQLLEGAMRHRLAARVRRLRAPHLQGLACRQAAALPITISRTALTTRTW